MDCCSLSCEQYPLDRQASSSDRKTAHAERHGGTQESFHLCVRSHWQANQEFDRVAHWRPAGLPQDDFPKDLQRRARIIWQRERVAWFTSAVLLVIIVSSCHRHCSSSLQSMLLKSMFRGSGISCRMLQNTFSSLH